MEAYEILESLLGPNEFGKCKSSLGFFVEDLYSDGTDEPLDEFYVSKPIVQVSEFSDDFNNDFYSIEFIYKSNRDEDLKQHWKFIQRFIVRYKKADDNQEIAPILSISLVPHKYNGKFSILAKGAYPNSITLTEFVIDGSCSIKMLFLKDAIFALEHDDEVIDMRQIEVEATSELEEEYNDNFGQN